MRAGKRKIVHNCRETADSSGLAEADRWQDGPLEVEIRSEVLTAEQDWRQFVGKCSVLMSGDTATEEMRLQVFGRDSGVGRR